MDYIKVITCIAIMAVTLSFFGCVSQRTTVSKQVQCNDSDNGKDYYVKGEINGPKLTTGEKPTDYCVFYSRDDKPSKLLVEYFCNNDSNIEFESETIDCQYGCFNGKCTLQNETCDGRSYCYNNNSLAYVDTQCKWYNFTTCKNTCENGMCK